MSVTIINNDCRVELRRMQGRDFHCCITDPPYGETNLAWDRRCDGWLELLAGALAPASSIWIFGSLRYVVSLFPHLEYHGFRYSQEVVWEKQNGTGMSSDRFRRVHEFAVMFYRGRWRDVYHAAQHTPSARAKVIRRKQRPAHMRHIHQASYVSEDGGPLLVRSVLKYPNAHGHGIHPTQKPVDLLSLLLRYSCPPLGESVDLFAGSGSLGVAAYQTGRRATLIEIDPYYVRQAELWISSLDREPA